MPGKPMQGLHGLYGRQGGPQQTMDMGVYEARASPGTAKSHGKYGSQALGYGGPVPGQSANPAVQGAYDSGFSEEYPDWGFEGGSLAEYLDRTPDVHSAPYPRGIIQEGLASLNTPGGLELVNEQIRQLHQRDLGGVKLMLQHDPAERQTVTRYTTNRYPAPNETVQGRNVPGQLRAGPAGTFGGGGYYGSGQSDTVQGYGKLNSLDEFQRGHSIRRIQHDRMPWDFTNTHGEQDVPFLGRHEIRQKVLHGPDSPYFEAGDISGQHIPWEGRIGFPHDWAQAPEPLTLPAETKGQDIWAYG